MTTAGAAKPREAHRHSAEQRRYPMKPPVFDVTQMTFQREPGFAETAVAFDVAELLSSGAAPP